MRNIFILFTTMLFVFMSLLFVACESQSTAPQTITINATPSDHDYDTEVGRYAAARAEYKNSNIFAIPGEDNRMFIVTDPCGQVNYVFFDHNNNNEPVAVQVVPCVEGKVSALPTK